MSLDPAWPCSLDWTAQNAAVLKPLGLGTPLCSVIVDCGGLEGVLLMWVVCINAYHVTN